MDMTTETAATVRDPVCGMAVDRATAAPTHAHAGRTFHFCSERCREKFAAAPEAWTNSRVVNVAPFCSLR